MALKCRCICGCKLLVSSGSAGKRIKCPKCERKLRVPSDVVEKRRAQLEARQANPKLKPAPTPPRSKIEKPLSSLVDLPDPEPPPVHTRAIEPVAAKEQPPEPSKPSSTPLKSEPSPEQTERKPDTPKRPPPLPTASKNRAEPLSETIKREAPAEIVDDQVAPSLLPSLTLSKPESEPATVPEPATKNLIANEAPHPNAEPASDDVEIPVRGYEADRDKVATVRWLATALLITGLIGIVPAIIDVVEHSLSDTSEGLSRWACGLLLVGLLQCAYAVYLVQLPDWSSVWVVTCFSLVIAASYAAMFGLTLLSSDQGHFVQILDLADRLRGGKATAWCLIMLSLMSLTSYFSGRVGTRWRNAFVG